MPYTETLAIEVRRLLTDVPKVREKKMFGGLAFMVADKMCVTVGDDRMMFRIAPALHEEAIRHPRCKTVVMRGRQYVGFVRVAFKGIKQSKEIAHWTLMALAYNRQIVGQKPKTRTRSL
ncbi:MAG: TfoX/Sxy family protein [Chryseolinea sp.]